MRKYQAAALRPNEAALFEAAEAAQTIPIDDRINAAAPGINTRPKGAEVFAEAMQHHEERPQLIKDAEPDRDKHGYIRNGFDELLCVSVQRYLVIRDWSFQDDPKTSRIGQDIRSLYNGGNQATGRQADLFDMQQVIV